MKKVLGCLAMLSVIAAALSGADAPAGKRTQFALTLSGVIVKAEGREDTYIGPGIRVDFNLGKLFMLSPEVMYLAGEGGGIIPGATVNLRFGKGYAGVGVTTGWFDEGSQMMYKAHIGSKGRRWLFTASFLYANSWLHGFGLTAGYIF